MPFNDPTNMVSVESGSMTVANPNDIGTAVKVNEPWESGIAPVCLHSTYLTANITGVVNTPTFDSVRSSVNRTAAVFANANKDWFIPNGFTFRMHSFYVMHMTSGASGFACINAAGGIIAGLKYVGLTPCVLNGLNIEMTGGDVIELWNENFGANGNIEYFIHGILYQP